MVAGGGIVEVEATIVGRIGCIAADSCGAKTAVCRRIGGGPMGVVEALAGGIE
jgi:hypothetical protein